MKIEQEIYSKILSRDEAGLGLLYDNYIDAFYGMAFRILKDSSFAEDAVQQSFLKIWNSIDQYDSTKSTLFTWMARIVKNTAIDTARLVSYQNEKKSESLDVNVHNVGSQNINEASIDALRMIAGLEEKYALVLDYLYLRGYTQRELSVSLDIPIGTIKTRVKKGLAILRTKYDVGKLLSIVAMLSALTII